MQMKTTDALRTHTDKEELRSRLEFSETSGNVNQSGWLSWWVHKKTLNLSLLVAAGAPNSMPRRTIYLNLIIGGNMQLAVELPVCTDLNEWHGLQSIPISD